MSHPEGCCVQWLCKAFIAERALSLLSIRPYVVPRYRYFVFNFSEGQGDVGVVDTLHDFSQFPASRKLSYYGYVVGCLVLQGLFRRDQEFWEFPIHGRHMFS